ncbi:hypothetical protein L2Y94_19635 [Luteibacter aegosomatis]|uniref:hypothetical protein n=1 Tax=Luteibacter aegosomatis TaxID=2911537 RepID=UPI001FFAA50D|nr:hypothetical protein [Luteibacter aegosomatis]UPG85488.1 hypothetical protein L2Y94_19635 [Luteibacter aegosomatis]
MEQKDIDILRHYASHRNRELYWNYLARIPGNDGYGALALGVVRNDNMPGSTANAYARQYARNHSGKVLSEREWDNFGVDLMKRDFAVRETHWKKNKSHLALNLPVLEVRDVHDEAFKQVEIDPNAWTPRKLLEAAHRRDVAETERRASLGIPPADTRKTEMEELWSAMLDNGYLGIGRAGKTLGQASIDRVMSPDEQKGYIADMASAYLHAAQERSYARPYIIGGNENFFMRERNGQWVEVEHLHTAIGSDTTYNDVTEPEIVRRLEDTYQLRLEREAARNAWHPDDPAVLQTSPRPLADQRPSATFPKPGDDPVYASIRLQLPLEVSDDKAAEVAAKVRGIGVHDEDALRSVDIDDGNIVCHGVRPGTAIAVPMDTPSPPKEESMALAAQSDASMLQQMQAMEMQQAQQVAMQRSGPVMSM